MAGQAPVRLSELPPAGALGDNDMVEVTQDGHSRRATVKQLFALGKSAYDLAKEQGYSGTLAQWLLSLKGDQGLQGLQGPKGDTGNQGVQGIPGVKGDKGDQGIQGLQGPKGDQGIPGLKGDKGDQGIQGLQGPQGDQGIPGVQGNPGIQGPQGLSAYQVAQAAGYGGTQAQWLASLIGATGADGKTVRSGSGAPASGVGTAGDFYIDTTNWAIYGPKVGTSWGTGTILIGPQGAQGIPGTNGTNGTNGANGVNGTTWLVGTGAPAAGAGMLNDSYLDKATADYYQKQAGGWVKIGSIATVGVAKTNFSFACSDETSALTAGTAKFVCRAPQPLTVSDLRASINTAQAGGSVLTVDLKVNGVSILANKLVFDNGSKTTRGASTPFTFSAAFIAAGYQIANDDELTVDISQVGDGTAKGLKLYMIGTDTSAAGLLGARLGDANVWTANQSVQPVTASTATGTYTPDASLTNSFQLTLGANTTINNPTNLKAGMTLNFCVDQDATGGRTITMGSLFKWPGGTVPTWNTTANGKNFFSAYYDGTILRCGGGAGYA